MNLWKGKKPATTTGIKKLVNNFAQNTERDRPHDCGRDRIQLPSNQNYRETTINLMQSLKKQISRVPGAEGTLWVHGTCWLTWRRRCDGIRDTVCPKVQEDPPHLLRLLKSFLEKALRRAIHWWLPTLGSRDNRIYCSRCPDVFDKVGHNQSSRGRKPSQNRMGPALTFAQEVGLPETSRYSSN